MFHGEHRSFDGRHRSHTGTTSDQRERCQVVPTETSGPPGVFARHEACSRPLRCAHSALSLRPAALDPQGLAASRCGDTWCGAGPMRTVAPGGLGDSSGGWEGSRRDADSWPDGPTGRSPGLAARPGSRCRLSPVASPASFHVERSGLPVRSLRRPVPRGTAAGPESGVPRGTKPAPGSRSTWNPQMSVAWPER